MYIPNIDDKYTESFRIPFLNKKNQFVLDK